ncbi:MAG: hypothetical protein IMZ63_03870 [Actinobacteria bacterium]|nr:hypothetical protein [Actinomycetota bacterium]
MKKIYENTNEMIYITGNRKEITLQSGDKINLECVINFEIEAHKGEKKNLLIIKDVKLVQNERITREEELCSEQMKRG